MQKEKPSIFERLLGTVRLEESDQELQTYNSNKKDFSSLKVHNEAENILREDSTDEEGQLSVDMYETEKEIILEAMVAGVRPDDLQLNIARDQVTIRGKREPNTQIEDDGYFIKELYWGAFSRTVNLPHEIIIEEADAVEKHGLLILRLPKLDKNRQAKIRVKSI
ncbi:MAG: Hsp20/alpha crystallin family protein [Minisyncoccia bacterium]